MRKPRLRVWRRYWARPHLVLAHVRHIHRIRPALAADLRKDLVGQQRLRPAGGVIIPALPAADLRQPAVAAPLPHQRRQRLQRPGRIRHQGNLRRHVFADLAGVNVDLDHSGPAGKPLRLKSHPIRKPSAHRKQQVRLVHSAVGAVSAVHSQKAQIHRVVIAQRPRGHQGVDRRKIRLAQKRFQKLLARRRHAAAKVHHRPLRLVQQRRNLRRRGRVAGGLPVRFRRGRGGQTRTGRR